MGFALWRRSGHGVAPVEGARRQGTDDDVLGHVDESEWSVDEKTGSSPWAGTAGRVGLMRLFAWGDNATPGIPVRRRPC